MRLETNSDNDINVMFGDCMLVQRQRSGMTQEQLAKRLDVSRALVVAYEAGGTGMTMERAVQISRILSIDLADFFSNPKATRKEVNKSRIRLNKIQVDLQSKRNEIAKIRSEMALLRDEALALQQDAVGRITDLVKR